MDTPSCDGCMAISGLTNGNSCIENIERIFLKNGEKKKENFVGAGVA